MPDYYPGVSNKPVTCLTAASPFWELEDMQPAASEGMGAVDPSGAPAAGAALSFQRRGATVPAPPEGGLAPEVLEFLRTLPPGE